MTNRCEVEIIFDELESLLRKLFDQGSLDQNENIRTVKLIENYWDIECPRDNPCRANTCSFARPIDWLEYCGYTSLNDYLRQLKAGRKVKYFDVFRADWARRPGHYNP